MAENVGSVEIDVDVDTRSLGPSIERAANRAARVYGREFSTTAGGELNSLFTKSGARLRTEAAKAGELAGDEFADGLMELVEGRVKRWDLDISQGVVFGEWRRALSTFDDVDDAVKRITARLEFLREEGQLTGAQFDNSVDSLQDWVTAARRATAEQERLAEATKAEAEALKDSAKIRDRQTKVIKETETTVRKTADSTEKLNTEEEKSFSLLGRLRGSRNNFLHLMGGIAQVMENLPRTFVNVGKGVGNFVGQMRDVVRQMRGAQSVMGAMRVGLSGLATSMSSGAMTGGLGTLLAVLAAFKALGIAAAAISTLTGIVTAFAAALTNALGGALLSVGPMIGALATGVAGVTLAVSNNQKAFEKAVDPLTEWTDEVGKAAGDALLPAFSDAVGTLSDVLEDRLTPLLVDSAEAAGEWAKSFADAMDSPAMRENLKTFEKTWPDILTNLGDIFTNTFTGLSGVFAAISPTVERVTGAIADAAGEFSDWANSAAGKNTVSDWFSDAADTAETLWDILTNVAEAIGNVFGAGSDTGDSFLESIEAVTEEFAKWTGTDKGREEIEQWFEDAADTAQALWEVVQAIGEWFDELDTEETRNDLNTLLGVIEGIASALETASSAADWLTDFHIDWGFLSEEIPAPEEIFGDWHIDWGAVFGGIGDWFAGQVEEWPAIGRSIVEGIQLGISAAWTYFTTWLGEQWNSLVATVKAIFGISSPSTVFASIGEDIINGLIQGLRTAWVNVTIWWNETAVPWFKGLPATVGKWFSDIWANLTQGISAGWAKVTGWWSGTAVPWFQGLPGKVGGWFSNMWSQFTDGISAGWAKVTKWWSSTAVPWFKGLPGKVSTWFSDMWNEFRTGIQEGWNKVTGWWSSTAVPWFKDLPNKVRGYFEDLWDEMVEAAEELPGKISAWWNGPAGWDRIVALFQNKDWGSIGADAAEGIVNGITGTDVGTDIRNWISNAIENAKSALGISSPSKVTMRELGVPIGQGVIVGAANALRSGQGRFDDALREVYAASGMRPGNRIGRVSGFVATNRNPLGAVQHNNIYVTAPQANPELVASSVVDRLVRSNVG